MTAPAPAPAPPTPPTPTATPFLGRTSEGRALLLSVRAGRSVALTAPPAYGKSALLRELGTAFEEITVPLYVPKIAPFGQFLNDLHDEMHAYHIHPPGVTITGHLNADRAAWKKAYPGGGEPRARSLTEALRRYVDGGIQPPVIVLDDAGGVTQSMVYVLLNFAAHSALVLAVYPETLKKAGTRRLWQACDRVELPALDSAQSRELVQSLTAVYGVSTPNTKAYENSVLGLSAGIPGEIVRLVRYTPAAEILQWRGGSSLGQNRADSQERGIALAPLLLVLGAVFIVVRVLGRARGEMDSYVVGQVGMAAMMIILPLWRGWLRAR